MVDRQTQIARMVEYAGKHGGITTMDAVTVLKIASPRKRLSEIRRDPRYRLDQDDVKVLDENGKQRTHYMRYRITEA